MRIEFNIRSRLLVRQIMKTFRVDRARATRVAMMLLFEELMIVASAA